MAGMICAINALDDTAYYTLGLWGKPVIYYPIRAALDSGMFDRVVVATNSEYIKYLMKLLFEESVVSVSDYCDAALIIDGRSALITPETIKAMLCEEQGDGGGIAAADENLLLVDSPNHFELALALIHQRTRPVWLRRMILERIQAKSAILSTPLSEEKEICLVGHSQFDQWMITRIGGFAVRNCGISGITAAEYLTDILKQNLLNCRTDAICVLIGINELVLPKGVDEIADDVAGMIGYLLNSTNAQVYYVETLLVNGRLDRSNERIVALNDAVKKRLPAQIKWIGTERMNDDFGHLDCRYTTDGLHLNDAGYRVLQQIIETAIVG